MQVSSTTEPPIATSADTIVVGVFDGEGIAHDTPGGELSELLNSGEARSTFKALGLTHADGRRWLLVGLGRREQFSAERARVAAAVAEERATEFGAQSVCWEVPHHIAPEVAAALVEGSMLAAYRFEQFRRRPPEDAPRAPATHLIVSAHEPLEEAVSQAALLARAVNAARDLQNRPANDLTPTALGRVATELAGEVDGLDVEVEGREALSRRGMGAFAAVAQGSDQEPALITLRYNGGAGDAPALGLVGKAVTFDSGGISIKPAAKMSEMKFDMSGGAAVLQAAGAIARLRLPINLIAVIGATENLPSGHAVKPGDIVTASNGTTIEINNTDAEGRLVLADCLCHAVSLGAQRLVDVATLTGSVVIALGSTYAGLIANDDAWAQQLLAAGATSGEQLWRLPLHEEYTALVRGRYADLDNSPEERKAGTIVGGEFLRHFVGETPWGHLDIAGSAWNLGRPYAARGAAGFGVRLLVELARAHSLT